MVRASAKTTVKGQEKVKKLVKEASGFLGAYLTIGVHQESARYPGGEDVVDVMMWNEFGTKTMPARSFIRSTIDENESLINQWRDEAILNMLDKGWSVRKSLEQLGQRIVLLIQKKIRSNVPPPLADSTAKAKIAKGRSPVTLIDTGQMLRAITYKVKYK
jgi:hypothetical protein